MQLGFRKGMNKYVIDIYRMRNQLHHFQYEIDEAFFGSFEQDLVSSGLLSVKIDLEKNDSFLGLEIGIKGTLELTCDRSLERFQHPIEESRKVIFKYGDEETEVDHDVIMITRETQQIDVGQLIFEFIGLAVPMKKLHPKFMDTDEEFGSWVYRSDEDQEQAPQETDPRWNKLNELKN